MRAGRIQGLVEWALSTSDDRDVRSWRAQVEPAGAGGGADRAYSRSTCGSPWVSMGCLPVASGWRCPTLRRSWSSRWRPSRRAVERGVTPAARGGATRPDAALLPRIRRRSSTFSRGLGPPWVRLRGPLFPERIVTGGLRVRIRHDETRWRPSAMPSKLSPIASSTPGSGAGWRTRSSGRRKHRLPAPAESSATAESLSLQSTRAPLPRGSRRQQRLHPRPPEQNSSPRRWAEAPSFRR